MWNKEFNRNGKSGCGNKHFNELLTSNFYFHYRWKLLRDIHYRFMSSNSWSWLILFNNLIHRYFTQINIFQNVSPRTSLVFNACIYYTCIHISYITCLYRFLSYSSVCARRKVNSEPLIKINMYWCLSENL